MYDRPRQPWILSPHRAEKQPQGPPCSSAPTCLYTHMLPTLRGDTTSLTHAPCVPNQCLMYKPFYPLQTFPLPTWKQLCQNVQTARVHVTLDRRAGAQELNTKSNFNEIRDGSADIPLERVLRAVHSDKQAE